MTNLDNSVLQRCNMASISAIEDIVGFDRYGERLARSSTSKELREKGGYWASHVLENPRAWILCCIYVMVTVISGYPLIFAICKAIGLHEGSRIVYATKVLDGIIYVFLPQICCLLIRLVQRRPLLHRMTARSVVIGDCPWVAQAVEAFASKIFACSYSAAGVNVYSANPSDHLVHRMTHRVVRGTLLACGRPDGRLQTLSNAEYAVCMSVNQASSIQSLGSNCESLTIGHNSWKLPLSTHSVFLKRHRPLFLCEQALVEDGIVEHSPQKLYEIAKEKSAELGSIELGSKSLKLSIASKRTGMSTATSAGRSTAELMGAFANIKATQREPGGIDDYVYHISDATKISLANMTLLPSSPQEKQNLLKPSIGFSIRDGAQTLPNVQPSSEDYFGQALRFACPEENIAKLIKTQDLSMQLYETRIASLQRAIAFFVLFHEMGKRVSDFWPSVSLGWLGYRMDRTHSILRVASTASPVSGAEVRDRMHGLVVRSAWKKFEHGLVVLTRRWKLRKIIDAASPTRIPSKYLIHTPKKYMSPRTYTRKPDQDSTRVTWRSARSAAAESDDIDSWSV
jgi:hypothetical protein